MKRHALYVGDGGTKVIILAGDVARSTGDNASHAGTAHSVEETTSHYGDGTDGSNLGSNYSAIDYDGGSEHSSAF